MRFTKILAATMAAMTIMSCSEQVEDFGANIQPGDAVLSFKVGTNGGTTYATAGQEATVKSLVAYVQYADPKGGADHITAMDIANATASITLKNGTYKPDADAKVYFIANMPGAAGVTTEAGLRELSDSKAIYKLDGDSLLLHADGMTATRVLGIKLTAGRIDAGTIVDDQSPVAAGKVPLRRLAARVYAESTTSADAIAGYTVEFSALSGSAKLFSNEGSGTGVSVGKYSIKGKNFESQYGKAEAVGYVYPSNTPVIITVSNGGKAQIVEFQPKSNKNYKLKITPSNELNPSFTVTIEEYDKDGEDIDVDFTREMIPFNKESLVEGLTLVGANAIAVQEVGVGTASTFLDLAGFLAADINLIRVELVSQPTTYSNIAEEFPVTSNNERLKFDWHETIFRLSFMPNNTGEALSYKFKYVYRGAAAGAKADSTYVTFTQAPLYPKDFSVKVGNNEWMSFNTQNTGNYVDDIAVYNKINAVAGATFFDKMVSFAALSVANNDLLAGNYSKGEAGTYGTFVCNVPTCPIGYAVPSTRLLRTQLFGVGYGESGEWTKVTEPFWGALDFPLVGVQPKPGKLSTGLLMSYTMKFTKSAINDSGNATIIDSNNNKALFAWRGNLSSTEVNLTRISGIASSTLTSDAKSMERLLIGVHSDLKHALIEHSSTVITNSTSSSLVRCVKQTPEMYWGK